MPEQADAPFVKVVAIMSVPMTGWMPHFGCVFESLRPFNMPLRLGYGAYWHQSMSNLLEVALKEGIDWVLTLDYDSLFTAEHLDRLIGVFGQNPNIDALAALQCKRGTEESPLMTVAGASEVDVTGEPIKVDTAHFGLTLIRLDALKRVPMPWFVGRPDENGSYLTERRTDPDITFWRQWQAVGNSAYVDPLCSIGHLQAMVAEFDENFEPRQVHVNDYRKRKAGGA